MNGTRRAVIGLLGAAAMAVAACSGEAEPDPVDDLGIDFGDRPFGPDPDFQESFTRLVTVPAEGSLDELVTALEAAADGLEMVLVPDPVTAEGARGFLLALPAKAAYSVAPGTGAANPLRLHAWTDEEGAARLSYFEPVALYTAIDPGLAEGGASVAARIAALAADAAGGEPVFGPEHLATYTEIPVETTTMDDLADAVVAAAEANGLRLLHEYASERVHGASDRTLVLLAESDEFHADLHALSPVIGVANPIHLHVWQGEQGAVVSYFDPQPLFSAAGPEFVDAGMAMSTLVSNVVWDAASA
jgi:hypothetical protein